MKYSNWKKWVNSKPWPFKWFIFLVLLRPLIDNFYFLKEISPFLSPLYIVGVLTPILCLSAVIKYKNKRKSDVDTSFALWSVFLILGAFISILNDPFSKISLEYLIKLSTPIYLFYFLRLFIQEKQDLDGVMLTFLYSGIFVASILLFEVFINPIRTVESRGMERIQGNFGDVVSYGIYISFSSLIAGYFFLKQKKAKETKQNIILLLIVGSLSLIALFNIHHVASYAVFIVIAVLFIFFLLKKNKSSTFLLLLLVGILGYTIGQELIEDKITPLLEKDIQVYHGEKDSDRLLHGRVGRWKMMWDLYTSKPILTQFLGYPFSLEYSFHVIGIGAHNDFIRLMFLSGFIGLTAYFNLLFQVYRRLKLLQFNQQFLAVGSLLILILYSVSITPTFYANFMYLTLSVFAYIALPKKSLLK